MNEIGERIIKLRKTGLSLREIALETGNSRSTISKWCATLKNNPDIIEQNVIAHKNIGMASKIKIKEHELLRQMRGDNSSDRGFYNLKLREAKKYFLMLPAQCKCQVCDYNRTYSALSFHHHDKLTKEFGINGTKFITYGLSRLAKEASKCALLCHNCHTEVHDDLLDVSHLSLSYGEIPESAILWYHEQTGQNF